MSQSSTIEIVQRLAAGGAPLATQTLAELIRHRHAALGRLRELGFRQVAAAVAAEDDLSALLAVLHEKQPWLEAVARISQELAPYRTDDAEQRDWPTPAERRECQRLWDECLALQAEVVACERRTEEILLARHAFVGRQLQEVASAQEVHLAYSNPLDSPTSRHEGRLNLLEE